MHAALTPLFAANDDGWHHGHWWLLWLVLWAAVIAGGVLLWRRRRGPYSGDPARQILAERFARGEIDATEYAARRDVLSQ